MMNLFVPLSEVFSAGAFQLAVFRSAFCCKENPVEGVGQETTTVFVCVKRMVSNGASGV
jgi:hypothetical protein